jgi:hypothetical protein
MISKLQKQLACFELLMLLLGFPLPAKGVGIMRRLAFLACLVSASLASAAIQTINSGGGRGTSVAGTTAQSSIGEPVIGLGVAGAGQVVKAGFAYLLGGDFTQIIDDPFDTDNTQPGGSTTGWSTFGATLTDPTLNTADYNLANGAYRIRTFSAANRFKLAGWNNNRLEWLPYTSIGTDKYVRGKFYMYSDGQTTPSDFRQIPNFAMRLAGRFVLTANLQLTTHNALFPNDDAFSAELRPSQDPTKPSVYRIDYDPIDVPFLQTQTNNEGVLAGFNVFTLEGGDNGYLGLTELVIGTYPASLLADANAIRTKIYAPGVSDAGNLRIYNTATDISIYNVFVPPASPVGSFGVIDPTPPLGTYSESSAGVTFNSMAVAADKVGVIDRAFFAGNADGSPGHDARIRAAENKVYKVRYHVTSTQTTSNQSWIWLSQRAIKFAYTQTLELAGGRSSTAANSVALARQSIPGVGSLNPDQISPGENGGWYTSIVNSPMHTDIRPEFPDGTALSTRMPLISAMPGFGVNSSSNRDFKVGAVTYDSISSAVSGAASEQGLHTIDRIEVREYNQIDEE